MVRGLPNSPPSGETPQAERHHKDPLLDETIGALKKWGKDGGIAKKYRDKYLALISVTCRWVEDSRGEYWSTGCSNAQVLLTGTPAENHYVWCPYCRGRIEEESC